MDIVDRLLSRIKVDDRGCFIWQGSTNNKGYGEISYKLRTRLAHRVSFEVFRAAPGCLHVLHHCDNPPCINPAHLFLGTQKTNMRDAAAKGRCNGTFEPTLSLSLVAEAKALYSLGWTHNEIAARLGITSTLSKSAIRHYAHVPPTVFSDVDKTQLALACRRATNKFHEEWTAEEDAIARDETKSHAEVAALTGRTKEAVSQHRYYMKRAKQCH